jgi:nucleotide-binding universal stress UspA family protein
MSHAPEHRIVVGIDGSPESLSALRWALNEAASTNATLEAVHCWQPHTIPDVIFGSPEEMHRGSVCMLRNEVQAALIDISEPPIVEETSVHGRPAHVLLERASRARLLVLGAHGHTDLHDVAFCRVTTSCLRHAACPVVVVDRTGTVQQNTKATVGTSA